MGYHPLGREESDMTERPHFGSFGSYCSTFWYFISFCLSAQDPFLASVGITLILFWTFTHPQLSAHLVCLTPSTRGADTTRLDQKEYTTCWAAIIASGMGEQLKLSLRLGSGLLPKKPERKAFLGDFCLEECKLRVAGSPLVTMCIEVVWPWRYHRNTERKERERGDRQTKLQRLCLRPWILLSLTHPETC